MIIEKQEHIPECECHEIHTDLVERSRAGLPETTELYDLSDFFKVLGDSTRLGILFAIDGAPLCVCDIASTLGMTKSAVSHQLRILKDVGVVKCKRQGKIIFYSLRNEIINEILLKGVEFLGY